MSFIANVRVMVPGEGAKEDFPGHYDLQLNANIDLYDRDFVNPVFSYRNDGTLDIFNQADSTNVYQSQNYKSCSVYNWRFVIENNSRLDEFCNLIKSVVSSTERDGTDNVITTCYLKDGNVFKNYDFITTNCFRAVATWLNALGNYTLKLIYDGTHDNAYMKYSAQKTVEKYADKCTVFNP